MHKFFTLKKKSRCPFFRSTHRICTLSTSSWRNEDGMQLPNGIGVCRCKCCIHWQNFYRANGDWLISIAKFAVRFHVVEDDLIICRGWSDWLQWVRGRLVRSTDRMICCITNGTGCWWSRSVPGMVVAFSSLARILGECSILFPACTFYYYFF